MLAKVPPEWIASVAAIVLLILVLRFGIHSPCPHCGKILFWLLRLSQALEPRVKEQGQ